MLTTCMKNSVRANIICGNGDVGHRMMEELRDNEWSLNSFNDNHEKWKNW